MMHWLRRLLEKHAAPIPEHLWLKCLSELPFLHKLAADELGRLKALSEQLLVRHTITGAAGFALTDEVAVSIAMQASLPVLNLTLDLYDDIAGIIVYPSEFVVPFSEMDDAGVVHEWREPISGEAIEAGGAVILSWEDIEQASSREGGCNLVIHEFAHKIDMRGGTANGRPPLLPEFHAGISAHEWQQAFSKAYADFMRRTDALETKVQAHLDVCFDPSHPEHAAQYMEFAADLPLDPYAARHPAEFFAVASEAFFVRPAPLAAAYPQVYHLLAAYYRQYRQDLPAK